MRRLLLVALALLGCDDDVLGLFDEDAGRDARPSADRGPPPDSGVACLGWEVDGECVGGVPGDRAEVCGLVARLNGCVDRDGDCFPGACDGPAVIPAEMWALIGDCDDTRPDIWPGAPERCDGVDDDCSGVADDPFRTGACQACGVRGEWACDAAAPEGVRCVAPELAGREEICDGLDDDCDGEVDEACRLDRPAAAARSQPAICGDRVVLIEDGGVTSHPLDPGVEATRLHEGPAAWPACSTSLVAWLALPEGGACVDQDGLTVCPRASVRVLDTVGEPADLTGATTPGPPSVTFDHVTWHALVGGAPLLKRHTRGQPGVGDLFDGQPLSDPSTERAGRLAARRWYPGGEARVVLRDAEVERALPTSLTGPPTLGPAHVAWSMAGAGLWVAPLDAPDAGFQLAAGPGPHHRLRLVGRTLVWLDAGTAPSTLSALDLDTGVRRTLARGVSPEGFGVDDTRVVWIAAGPDGPAIYLDSVASPGD